VSASAWLAGGLGLCSWLAALPVSAAISAQIPPECGSLAEFELELEQRLGNVSTPDATRVTLTPEVSGYRLVVEAGNQTRELHDASCQELLRAAVVIALALLEPKREQVPASAPEPARSVLAEQPEQRAANTARRPPLHFALAAGGGLHVGTLPQPTLILEFDAQLKWARFGGAAGFRYLLPQTTVDENNRGARIGAVGAYLAGSFEPWHRLQARLGIATYRLSASGIGSTAAYDGSAWELSPTLGATFIPFERPPFWTSVGLEGQLNLIRRSFEILNYHEVFRTSLLSGSAFARAGVVF